jgi:hypothetical protein
VVARLILLAAVVAAAACGAGPAAAGRGAATVPGALPRGFHFTYGTAIDGWPVLPIHRQHPIRGAFLDPRGNDENGLAGYHFGIDVNVDDGHPDPGAPAGLSHRVFALEGGFARVRPGEAALPCAYRRVEVAHFSYWHVSPIVADWQRIAPGQQIGWTCLGQWHVHLSEWARMHRKLFWVNPLHRGGKIAPYVDTQPPVVDALRFVAPAPAPWHPHLDLTWPDGASPLAPSHLHGLVELRAEIGDGQSFWGFLERHPTWKTMHHPYRVAVRITALDTSAIVLERVSFQADQLPDTPYLVHYAPGTVQNGSVDECIQSPDNGTCAGVSWFRPFSRHRQELWNTRTVPNGTYLVTVTAWDIRGNRGSRSARVTVAN